MCMLFHLILTLQYKVTRLRPFKLKPSSASVCSVAKKSGV